MTKYWFRKNHASASPERLAEAQNLVARQEVYDRAKDATIHLLTALKQWPGFDSTGSNGGAIDHTLVNIERLDDALDDLRDQVDKLRGQQVADALRRGGHQVNLRDSLDSTVSDVKTTNVPSPLAVAAMVKLQPRINAVLARASQLSDDGGSL